ncbi:YcdB/YcdC domain-containing protein [Neobacillus sp. FSL H8-0543]|uniref:YcdB/YcdC domain-containing protein n=1 Tax=Neobacillus sp. FSL H8-0543 TaxID=2954672 RepID=UPI0031594712
MLKEELQKRALSIIPISVNFQPVIEEYTEGEAMFSWTNEEKDEDITINLDINGNLLSLSIDKNDKTRDIIPLNFEESKERAERFLLSHYPNALNDLTLYKSKKLTCVHRFYYEQIVMDLPLENAGCYIDIDPLGEIVGFTYQGVKRNPEIPAMLISKEKLIEHVLNRVDFQLLITYLYSDIHNVAEDGLHLVYDLDPYFMEYKADVLEPTLTIIHEEDSTQSYVTLAPPTSTIIRKYLSNEEIIGITEQMEVIREVDMGEEIGIVWRERDWEMKEEDLSINGFFTRQTEDTVKAFISKKTGKVRSYIWFKERSGDLQLNRKECYQKAIDFLQMLDPNYYQYLQLIVWVDEEEEDETRMKESFTFHLHNGQDIPVQLALVMVVVNPKTGEIDHYSGPSFDLEQLSQISAKPAISKKEAREIFSNHLDFELAWSKNYDSETDSYSLVYKACDRFSRNPIRYIDAMNGSVIINKE